jgi:hypothetical protein
VLCIVIKTLFEHHSLEVGEDDIIFIAECAGIVRYQVTRSTRLGPSNGAVNVTILDAAYATGREAHDRITVSKCLIILVTARNSFRLSPLICPVCMIYCDLVRLLDRIHLNTFVSGNIFQDENTRAEI